MDEEVVREKSDKELQAMLDGKPNIWSAVDASKAVPTNAGFELLEVVYRARREERERIVRWLKKWADWYRELIPAGRIVSDALDARAVNLRENWLAVPEEARNET